MCETAFDRTVDSWSDNLSAEDGLLDEDSTGNGDVVGGCVWVEGGGEQFCEVDRQAIDTLWLQEDPRDNGL